MTTQQLRDSAFSGMGTYTGRRMLMWVLLSVLVALMVYFGFRGYLNPEFLFNFASHMYC